MGNAASRWAGRLTSTPFDRAGEPARADGCDNAGCMLRRLEMGLALTDPTVSTWKHVPGGWQAGLGPAIWACR